MKKYEPKSDEQIIEYVLGSAWNEKYATGTKDMFVKGSVVRAHRHVESELLPLLNASEEELRVKRDKIELLEAGYTTSQLELQKSEERVKELGNIAQVLQNELHFKEERVRELERINDHPFSVMKEISDKHPAGNFDKVQFEYAVSLEIKYNEMKKERNDIRSRHEAMMAELKELKIGGEGCQCFYTYNDIQSIITKYEK